MEENQSKALTLNEFKAKLEVVKLEDMTEQELLGYIAYGTPEELNNTRVQKQLIKYRYLEYLIHIVDKLEVTEEILGEMTSSEIFKTKGYTIKRGIIEHIEIGEHSWLPEDYIWLVFEVQDENKQDQYKIKYLHVKQKFKQRLKTLIGKQIMAIVEQKDGELYVICFLGTAGAIQ